MQNVWEETAAQHKLERHQPDPVVASEAVQTEICVSTLKGFDLDFKTVDGLEHGKVLKDNRKCADDSKVTIITTINGAYTLAGGNAVIVPVHYYNKASYKYGKRFVDRETKKPVQVSMPGVGLVDARCLVIAESQRKRTSFIRDFVLEGNSFYLTRRGYEPVVDGIEALYSKSVVKLAESTYQPADQVEASQALVVRNQDLKSTDPRKRPGNTKAPEAATPKDLRPNEPITQPYARNNSRENTSEPRRGRDSYVPRRFNYNGPKYAPLAEQERRDREREDREREERERVRRHHPTQEYRPARKQWFNYEKTSGGRYSNERRLERWSDRDDFKAWRHHGELSESPEEYSPTREEKGSSSERSLVSRLNPLAEPFVGNAGYSPHSPRLSIENLQRIGENLNRPKYYVDGSPKALDYGGSSPAREWTQYTNKLPSFRYPSGDATEGNAQGGPSEVRFALPTTDYGNISPPRYLTGIDVAKGFTQVPTPTGDFAPPPAVHAPADSSVWLYPDGSEWKKYFETHVYGRSNNSPAREPSPAQCAPAPMEVDAPIAPSEKMKISEICDLEEGEVPSEEADSATEVEKSLIPAEIKSGRPVASDFYDSIRAILPPIPEDATPTTPIATAGCMPAISDYMQLNPNPAPVLEAYAIQSLRRTPEPEAGSGSSSQVWKDAGAVEDEGGNGAQGERYVSEKNGVRFFHPLGYKPSGEFSPDPAKRSTSTLTKQILSLPNKPADVENAWTPGQEWEEIEREEAMEEESDAGAYDLLLDHEARALTKQDRARKLEKKRARSAQRTYEMGRERILKDAQARIRELEREAERKALEDFIAKKTRVSEGTRSKLKTHVAWGKEGDKERKAMRTLGH
ncbi:hypothetical protein P7C70_g8191, partial [Phenoliferia sp. Uapishka_3]